MALKYRCTGWMRWLKTLYIAYLDNTEQEKCTVMQICGCLHIMN